nr:MAG TPA: hypothetical protein [Caudoviricetes sp.]
MRRTERNETKDAGTTQADKASKRIQGKQGKPKGTCIRRRQASFLQWVTFNEERPINTRRYLQ